MAQFGIPTASLTIAYSDDITNVREAYNTEVKADGHILATEIRQPGT